MKKKEATTPPKEVPLTADLKEAPAIPGTEAEPIYFFKAWISVTFRAKHVFDATEKMRAFQADLKPGALGEPCVFDEAIPPRAV